MQSKEELARAAFDGYNTATPNPGKTFDGRPVPQWDHIAVDKKPQIQGKWSAAVSAVGRQVIEDLFTDIDKEVKVIGSAAKQRLARIKAKHLGRLD